MIKHLPLALAAIFTFVFAITGTVSAAETGAGVSVAPTKHNVMTDMIVPPTCLDMGKTVCAQLPGNSTKKLLYGTMCYTLKNKTGDALFVPLRSDAEIESFLLNVPANVVYREPCETN